MKRIFLFTLVCIFTVVISLKSNAQGDAPDTLTYERNYSQILQAGISVGYYGYGYTGNRVGLTIPLTAAYETYFGDHISGGGFLGYASYKYEGVNGNQYGWTFFDFGFRASYHYIHILNELTESSIDPSKFDFYITVMLIFENRSYSSDSDYYSGFYDSEFDVIFGPVAGFRYKFSDRFAAYFEGGRGTFGYGTIGVSLMF